MTETVLDLALDDWSLPLGLTAAIAGTAAVYVRGWLALRRTRAGQFTGLRLASFLGGLAVLWIAIASPLESLADALVSAHMVEHLILMSLVPPLVLLGWPVVPLLRGLPRAARLRIAGPLLRRRWLRRLLHALVRPRVAWLAMNAAFVGWHIPAAYDYALEHELVHDLEHICFLATSLLFWFAILRPWPARQTGWRWSILLYLIGADAVNSALSGFLAFCGRPVFSYYLAHPNAAGIEPLPDQVTGAVVMWTFGSIAFLIPAVALTFRMLEPRGLAPPCGGLGQTEVGPL